MEFTITEVKRQGTRLEILYTFANPMKVLSGKAEASAGSIGVHFFTQAEQIVEKIQRKIQRDFEDAFIEANTESLRKEIVGKSFAIVATSGG